MSKVDDLIAAANKELGVPYHFGAEQPGSAFDCSGLTQWVFGQVGISLPRTAEQQQNATTRVSNPLPGDLVFFGNPAYHVGLYLGGGKMISAPHTGAVVHITDVGNPTNYGRVSGLGTQTAALTAAFSPAGLLGGASVTDVLGGVRNTVVELSFAGLGLALAGYGVYRIASPATRRQLSNLTGGAL